MMRSLVTRLALGALAIPVLASAQVPPATGAGSQESGRPERTFRVSGWTRTSVEVNPWSGEPTGGTAVPRDDLAVRELLYVRSRFTYGRSFEAVGSALLAFDLFHAQGGLQPSGETRGDARVELREAYVGLAAGDVDLRAGRQRITWGHGDIFSPNDVVNAADSRDPILAETGFRHVPTLALRADLALAGAALQVVAEPVFEADRYHVYGPNWALLQPGAPAGYRGLLGALAAGAGGAGDDVLLLEPPRPGGLSGTQAGLRLDWRRRRADVSHYYHYGFHGMPGFHVGSEAGALDSVDWAGMTPDQAAAIAAVLTSSGAVGSAWERRHHVGLDVATTAGPFVLRLEAAHQQPALFYDRGFNAWLSPATEAVVGVEYQTGTLGRTVIVESRYRHISRPPPDGGLLFTARDSLDAAVLARWTAGAVQLEMRGVVGLQPRSVVLRPQIAWTRDALAVRAGVVVIGGDDRSFGGWYRRNRGVYVMVRRDF